MVGGLSPTAQPPLAKVFSVFSNLCRDGMITQILGRSRQRDGYSFDLVGS